MLELRFLLVAVVCSAVNLVNITNIEYSSIIIDISHWQEGVNLTQVNQSEIVAVIHKATQNTSYVDPKYIERRKEAENAGLLWGAYHLSVPGNPVEQADHFLNTVGTHSNVLLVLDLEVRNKTIMSTKDGEMFVMRIKEKVGRYPVLYGNRFDLVHFDSLVLNNCSLWIAMYSNTTTPILPKHRESWVLWQYTNGQKGGMPRHVEGVGYCDRDRYNGTKEELLKQWPHL